MLMLQSVENVRLFFLMAYYLLGVCHRNAALMFLGVAARAAINLELHTSENSNTTPSQGDDETRQVAGTNARFNNRN